jgi:hypothetical protein
MTPVTKTPIQRMGISPENFQKLKDEVQECYDLITKLTAKLAVKECQCQAPAAQTYKKATKA